MKKKIQIVMVFVVGFLTIMLTYDVSTPDFKMYKFDDHTHLVINNQIYVPNRNYLRSDLAGERIGFVESNYSFFDIFYIPFKHGVYEIVDSSGERFYKVLFLFREKQYSLFVEEDFKTDFLSKSECSTVVIEGYENVTDSEVIDELISYLNSDPTNDDIISSVNVYKLRLYSKEFPSIYHFVEVLQSKSDGSVWLSDLSWAPFEHVKIPSELFEKLTANPLS